ncbi:BON domain-containing protein [Chitinimonas koreensis]|uniref:BON domain-containing protein n=1 Tax=Chitinimonas koreensis TaxID=356302 RepID=UPI000408EFE8|nr:BON domain-containing protein [Chitinimonas koreensis]QNM95359.1 BON domain-containing protein [Chitinimonas koreensis]
MRAPRSLSCRLAAAAAAAFVAAGAAALADDNPFDDPFEQAVRGDAACPAPKRPVLDEADLRREAHQRHERGVSCWLARQCEEGGPYKHDHATNAAVVAAIRADARFARSSIWVETLRGYVTLHGCLRSRREQRALEAVIKPLPRVVQVWNHTRVGRHTH